VSQRLAIPSSGKCPQEPGMASTCASNFALQVLHQICSAYADVTLSGSTSHMLGVRPEDLISATLPPEAKAQVSLRNTERKMF
jgi:hypothetical protein